MVREIDTDLTQDFGKYLISEYEKRLIDTNIKLNPTFKAKSTGFIHFNVHYHMSFIHENKNICFYISGKPEFSCSNIEEKVNQNQFQ